MSWKEIFKDDNKYNEKSIIGFLAFLIMTIVMLADVITGWIGKDLVINEAIYNSFVMVVLGCFGIAGLGTYYAYVDGTHFKVDFKPDSAVGVAHTINTLAISLASADSGLTGIGTQQLNTCIFDSGYASISASGSPGVTSITSYSGGHSCAYYITCVEDTTNNKY